MPELPDIEAYISALRRTIEGRTIRKVRLKSVFLDRSIDPPFDAVVGTTVVDFRRIGKRIVFELDSPDGRLWMVLHLMIAGRLLITEASKKKRASIYLVGQESGLEPHNPGGLEVADVDLTGFAAAIRRENHTLKRTLTDPRILSGIGGAYADEIMFRARISPIKWTS